MDRNINILKYKFFHQSYNVFEVQGILDLDGV